MPLPALLLAPKVAAKAIAGIKGLFGTKKAAGGAAAAGATKDSKAVTFGKKLAEHTVFDVAKNMVMDGARTVATAGKYLIGGGIGYIRYLNDRRKTRREASKAADARAKKAESQAKKAESQAKEAENQAKEAKNQVGTLAKLLLKQGFSTKSIADSLNTSEEEITRLLSDAV